MKKGVVILTSLSKKFAKISALIVALTMLFPSAVFGGFFPNSLDDIKMLSGSSARVLNGSNMDELDGDNISIIKFYYDTGDAYHPILTFWGNRPASNTEYRGFSIACSVPLDWENKGYEEIPLEDVYDKLSEETLDKIRYIVYDANENQDLFRKTENFAATQAAIWYYSDNMTDWQFKYDTYNHDYEGGDYTSDQTEISDAAKALYRRYTEDNPGLSQKDAVNFLDLHSHNIELETGDGFNASIMDDCYLMGPYVLTGSFSNPVLAAFNGDTELDDILFTDVTGEEINAQNLEPDDSFYVKIPKASAESFEIRASFTTERHFTDIYILANPQSWDSTQALMGAFERRDNKIQTATIGASLYAIDVSKFYNIGNTANSVNIAGAVFELYFADEDFNEGDLIDTKTTGENGELVFDGLLSGNYILKETAVPYPFLIDDQSASIEITLPSDENDYGSMDGNTLYLGVHNNIEQMRLKLYKHLYGSEDKAIEGAEFELYYAPFTNAPPEGSGQPEYADYINITPSTGNYITDEKGEVFIDGFEPGYFYFKEISVPAPYYFDSADNGDIFPFEIPGAQLTEDENGSNLYVLNIANKEKYNLLIVKQDVDNETAVKGAEFDLYKKNDDGKYELVELEKGVKIITDGNGEYFIEGLDKGNYKLVETYVPAPYILDDTEHFIELPSEETDGENFTFICNIWNDKSYDLKIIKHASGNVNTLLSGAEFKLYKKGKEGAYTTLVGTVTTGMDGVAIFGSLPKGTYHLIETKAPNGYDISFNNSNISIPGDTAGVNNVIEVKIPNSPASNPNPIGRGDGSSRGNNSTTVSSSSSDSSDAVNTEPTAPSNNGTTDPAESTQGSLGGPATMPTGNVPASTESAGTPNFTFVYDPENDYYIVYDEDGTPLGFIKQMPEDPTTLALGDIIPFGTPKFNPQTGYFENPFPFIATIPCAYALYVVYRFKKAKKEG